MSSETRARRAYNAPYAGANLNRVAFPLGGLVIARTDYLRRHGYPDRGMAKGLDDVLLGELSWAVAKSLLSGLAILAVIWGQNIGAWVAKPFEGLFTGGSAPPEPTP